MDKNSNASDDFSLNEASSESPNTFSTPNFTPKTDSPSAPPENQFSPSTPNPVTPPPPPEPAVKSGLPELPKTPPPVTPTKDASEFVTTSGGNGDKKSNFGKFVIIGIVIILLIYGVVLFLYLRNKKIKGETGTSSNQAENIAQEGTTPEVTETPQFSPELVKVVNGNIVYENPSGSTVLIDKANYPGTGIIGFAKVTVSPDNTKLCFEALAPAPDPAIYVSDVDGANAKEANKSRMQCNFTKDSKKLIYQNSDNLIKDIFIYDIEGNTETNLTPENLDVEFEKSFNLVGFSEDGSLASCTFQDVEGERSGQCEINLTTGSVTFL